MYAKIIIILICSDYGLGGSEVHDTLKCTLSASNVSQKPTKRISPNFGRKCIWFSRGAD